jgi:hypothetical protein
VDKQPLQVDFQIKPLESVEFFRGQSTLSRVNGFKEDTISDWLSIAGQHSYTPAMAVGLTGHIWTLRRLWTLVIPPSTGNP